MTYAFYETEKQFQQAAFVFVAMSLNEAAGYLISDGNIAQAEEIALFELISIARSKSFDAATKMLLALMPTWYKKKMTICALLSVKVNRTRIFGGTKPPSSNTGVTDYANERNYAFRRIASNLATYDNRCHG